jgi:1,4-dihydroxy-2-naphthoyl-CoA hydrolase
MIEQLNHLCNGTFISFLGIEFLEMGDDFIEASMPVDNKLQPMGLLHGGASLALAETIASGGSYLMVDPEKYDVFGLQVSGNHISSIARGIVYARGEIIHKGRSTHVWDVKIRTGNGKLISVIRVTIMIVKKTKQDY